MSESIKPTPGPWEAERIDNSNCFDIKCECGFFIATCHDGVRGESNAEDNARLIAEAGTVFHNTGLSPVQLVEMVENLKELAADFMDAQADLDNREHMGIHAKPYEVLMRRRNLARDDLDAALAKCEGVKP